MDSSIAVVVFFAFVFVVLMKLLKAPDWAAFGVGLLLYWLMRISYWLEVIAKAVSAR